MKKHAPGFVPVTYWKVGVVLLVIGTAALLVSLAAAFTGSFAVLSYVPFVGAVFALIGLYLIFVVPRE